MKRSFFLLVSSFLHLIVMIRDLLAFGSKIQPSAKVRMLNKMLAMLTNIKIILRVENR